MNYLFCQLSLFLWLPILMAFFAFLPPRRAVFRFPAWPVRGLPSSWTLWALTMAAIRPGKRF